MPTAPAADRAPRAAELTFPEAAAFARRGAIALLPIGSTEAHGPHLPLDTDVLIAEGVCDRAFRVLRSQNIESVVFPPITYGVTDFARPFAGTVSLSAEALEPYVEGVIRGILEHGFAKVVLVNHHLEPAHFAALHQRVFALRAEGLKVGMPDHRKKTWALELGEEFCRGGAHAGFYETSLVLACAPHRVREEERKKLPTLEVDLGQKIRDGARDFLECGGDEAYFGSPALATAEEGERLLEVLARAVVDVVYALDLAKAP